MWSELGKRVFVSDHLRLNTFLHKFSFMKFHSFFSSKIFDMLTETLYQEKMKATHMENSLQFLGSKG